MKLTHAVHAHAVREIVGMALSAHESVTGMWGATLQQQYPRWRQACHRLD